MGGKFLLRIEDTDKERNTPEAVRAIYGGMRWLNLDHDDEVILQSERADRHVEVAHKLVELGAAYYDYTTPEQMAIYRKDWSVSGNLGPFRYDSPFRDTSAGKFIIQDRPYTIRLKAPREGETVIHDLVQGDVKVANKELDDMILLRGDGTPTYMLAVVVDDHDMGVTHVIRGDDHLNNAFRQLSIYKAMGWPIPIYAHIPLIHGEDGKKLSKRTGAAAVEDYRDMGIRSEAMLNYLARLGWGHGDDEIFTMDQAIEWFDIKNVGRAPARLDKKKLASINSHYIRQVEPHHLALEILPALHARGIETPPFDIITGAMSALRERSSDMNALVDGTMFLWAARPIVIDEKAQTKLDRVVLSGLLTLLKGVDDTGRPGVEQWQAEDLMELIKAYAGDRKLGEIMTPLRAALTGSLVSPPIDAVMVLLGKAETLGRIEDALNGF